MMALTEYPGRFFFVEIEKAATPKGVTCTTDMFWLMHRARGLMYYYNHRWRLGDSEKCPQCNRDRGVVEYARLRFRGAVLMGGEPTGFSYDDLEIVRVPVVFDAHASDAAKADYDAWVKSDMATRPVSAVDGGDPASEE